MTQKTLADIASKMRGIDIAMLATRTKGGHIASRPMSNNGQVDYDGASYYFTDGATRKVRDIEGSRKVSLGFSGKKGFYAAVSGEAELIRDKSAFEKHWSPDLDKWFKDGIDTKGLVMIKVTAQSVQYWDGEDGGEIKV